MQHGEFEMAWLGLFTGLGADTWRLLRTSASNFGLLLGFRRHSSGQPPSIATFAGWRG